MVRASFLALLGFLGLGLPLSACGASSSPANDATTTTAEPAQAVPTKVTAFSVSSENLQVDKVGMRDGELRGDDSKDLAFTATVEGGFSAVFVYACNEKGEPAAGLRADTLIGTKDIPPELGSVVDQGKMTFGVGVYENGKLSNEPTGTLRLGPGTHQLSLYVPNSSQLKTGDSVCLWVRSKGVLARGPVAKY